MEELEKSFYKDDNFELSYQEIDDRVFIHCRVINYGRKIYKLMLLKYIDLKEYLFGIGYNKINAITSDDRLVYVLDKTAKCIAHLDYNNKSCRVYEVELWEIQ